jgi:hypothetical protein
MDDERTLDAGGAEPGPEMDALVAVRVLGLAPVAWGEATPCPECGGEMRYCGARSRCCNCSEWRYSAYREYSTEIVAAWQVVEALAARDFVATITSADVIRPGAWLVWFIDASRQQWFGEGPTAPIAISRAALRAFGIGSPDQAPLPRSGGARS